MAKYCGQLKESNESLNRIRRFSKRARIAFKILFCFVLVGLVILVAACFLAAIGYAEKPSPTSAAFLPAIPSVTFLTSSLLIFWFLEGIFEDIAKEESPFSKKQSKRLKLIALLSLLIVVVDLIIQALLMDYSYIVQLNPGVEVGYVGPQRQALFHIDVKSLVGAMVFYCLSKLFDYGTCIQSLSDETL